MQTDNANVISIASHVAYWNRAARRADHEGNRALAITFRNMAWLVEHRESWREWVKTQDVQVSEQSTEPLP